MTSGLQRANHRVLLLLVVAGLLPGCASLISGAASDYAEDLSAAILNQDDPETAKAALPSFMVFVDSLIEGHPDNPALLAAAANLYASYGAVFADDPERAARLTAKARRYGLAAMCERDVRACGWDGANFEEFTGTLDQIDAHDAKFLYTYGFATLAYMRAHSSDWDTLAELPQIEALFDHYLDIAGDDVAPATHTYMGILQTLRPPALGGKPEEAREHFEKAIALSDGRDLSAKVEFARGYARLMYDRELHDRLLGEVLDANPYADGLTLTNVLAQNDAKALLAEADDYF
jgi:TRAP transporter T-component